MVITINSKSHHQFQHLVHLSRHSFNFFYGECRVFNYCRVWFRATITVTTARLVLRNNNRYSGAFGFAQQLPLQRRVWFCATIKVSLFSTFEEKVSATTVEVFSREIELN